MFHWCHRDGEVVDERGKPQTGNDDPNLALDIGKLEWYAYNENYGTSEEKRFVKVYGRAGRAIV